MDEKDVAARTTPEGATLPLRVLRDFEVVSNSNKKEDAAGDGRSSSSETGGMLLPLDSLVPLLPLDSRPLLKGQVVTDSSQPPVQLAPAPLLDWVVDHGSTAIWAATPLAWYRLEQPSASYAPLFASALHRAGLLRSAAAESELQAAQPSSSAKRGAQEVSSGHLAKSRKGPGGSRLRFVSAAANIEAAGGSELQAASEGDATQDSGVCAGQAWGTAGATGAVQRGAPPEPQRDFRVPMASVSDLLMVWEFTQTFSELLQLPPYSLAALEAAVNPGPRLRRSAGAMAVPEAPTPKEEAGVASPAVSQGRRDLLPLGVQQELQQHSGIAVKEENQEVLQGDKPNADLAASAPAAEEQPPLADQQPGMAMCFTPAEQQQEPHQGAAVGQQQAGSGGLDEQQQTPGEEAMQQQQQQDPLQAHQAVEQEQKQQDALLSLPTSQEAQLEVQRGSVRKSPKVAPQNVVDPIIRTRRQVFTKQEGSSSGPGYTPQLPLRFCVSLGHQATERRATPQQPQKAAEMRLEQAEQVQRLQEKYGLRAEAARRLLPLDRSYAPSGGLLRDVFCALLRVVAGKAVRGDQPRLGKLQSEDNDNPLPWPERVCLAVWQSVDADADDRAVAIKLGYGEFQDLSAVERLRLLAAMVRLVLGSTQFQEEVNQRLEALAAVRRSKDATFAGGPGDEESDEELEGVRAAINLPPLRPTAAQGQATPATSMQQGMGERSMGSGADSAGAVEAGEEEVGSRAPASSSAMPPWMSMQQTSEAVLPATNAPATATDWATWLQQRCMGLRRPLGADVYGRRYWCFGQRAGAFRIYVEEREGQLWGWYEGEQITKLCSWLEKSQSAIDSSLLQALRSAPLPTATGKPRLLSGPELDPLRPDGYRNLNAPLLRGEWDAGNSSLASPADQRILLATEAVLGVVPVWFKEPSVLEQHLAISESMQQGHALGVANALLVAEEMLASEDGRLTEEWVDVWQQPWRRGVASCGDPKELMLYSAALQQHVRTHPDLISRQAFLRYAIDAQSALTCPLPGDNVVVLRTGLLQHVDRYIQLLGLDAMPVQQQQQQGLPLPANHPTGASMEVDAAGCQLGMSLSAPDSPRPQPVATGNTATDGASIEADPTAELARDSAKSTAQSGAAAGATLLMPRIQMAKKQTLRANWQALKKKIQAMRPVERYIVRSVVYRRHLVDDADVEHSEADVLASRWPVAWLILRPAKYGPRHQLPAQDLVLPLAVEGSLPDYLVKAEHYAARMRVLWQPGDRLQMFEGGKISSKTHKKTKSGGVWHKGTIASMRQSQPAQTAPVEVKQRYDPWESVVVQWDKALPGEFEAVCPWEIEVDPEEQIRRIEEAQKQKAAAARAQRARQSARRSDDGEPATAADERAVQLTKEAERAQQLLNYPKQPGPEDESTFNEQVYSRPQTSQLQPRMPVASPAVQQYHAAVASSAPTQLVPPTQPLQPGQEVPQEALDVLRLLSAEQFICLLTNFYRGLKGKFKIPTFAHQELDLHKVFWGVMERNGYESVTACKQWKEICRCLPVDLTGQTSASYNMRLNYERCLLDFENYLACGQFQRDLAAGCAPESDYLTDPTTTKFTIPGVDYSTPVAPSTSQGRQPASGSQRPTRGSSRLAQKATAAAAAAATGMASQGSQDDLLASIAAAFDSQPAGAAPDMPVLPLVDPGQRAVFRWAPSTLATESAAQAAAAVIPAGPGSTAGQALSVLGLAAVGRPVERFWPEEGGWWAAHITGFNEETGEHQVTYNLGQEEESYEWLVLAGLGDHELRDASAAGPQPHGLLPSDIEAAIAAAAEFPPIGGYSALLQGDEAPQQGGQQQQQPAGMADGPQQEQQQTVTEQEQMLGQEQQHQQQQHQQQQHQQQQQPSQTGPQEDLSAQLAEQQQLAEQHH